MTSHSRKAAEENKENGDARRQDREPVFASSDVHGKNTVKASAALDNITKVSNMVLDKFKDEIKEFEDSMPSAALEKPWTCIYSPSYEKYVSYKDVVASVKRADDVILEELHKTGKMMYTVGDVARAWKRTRERVFGKV